MAGTAEWASARWREHAVDWIDVRLAESGRRRTGPVDQPRLRPWGTLLSVPTDRGRVWLKVPGPGNGAEVALHRQLARVTPELVPEAIAADPAAGMLLLADAGITLNRYARDAALIDTLAAALPGYARLQRAVMPYADTLRAAGVPDMRAAVLPHRFEEALRIATTYAAAGTTPRAEHAVGCAVDGARLQELRALREQVAGWCERLRQARVPASLDHNDLHANNILVDGGGQVRFADWGDAVLGHPFAGMKITLGTVAHHGGLTPEDPVIVRLRDAYLGEFADLAPHATLVAELELAGRLAAIAGALAWDRALHGIAPAEAGRYGDGPLRRLYGLAAKSWLTLAF